MNEVSDKDDEELSSRKIEELSIGGNDDDENEYESNIKSTRRELFTNQKENNWLLTSQKNPKNVSNYSKAKRFKRINNPIKYSS